MYCYGIARTGAIGNLDLIPAGIREPLRWVICGELSALIEMEFSVAQHAIAEADLLTAIVAHDRVLRSVFDVITVLPLRFGVEFSSEAALRQQLQHQTAPYLRQLTQLENKAEVTLTLTAIAPPEVPIPAHLTGRDYFMAKKQQSQQQQNWQQECDQLRQQAVTLLQQWGIQVKQKGEAESESYFLLYDRSLPLDTYCQQWQKQLLQLTGGQWNYALGEPMPPYHFLDSSLF